MRKALLSVAYAFAMVGAKGQTTVLTAEVLAPYTGKSVAHTEYPVPSFTVFKTGNAMFGLLGALTAYGSGDGMVKAQGVNDPAPRIGQALVSRLAANLGGSIIPPSGPSAKDAVAAAIASAPGADLLVDVKTDGWGLAYLPTAWQHYTLGYRATLRVIDASAQSVLAEASCRTQVGRPRGATEEQVLANGAQLLKYYVQQAQFDCTDQFAKAVLDLAALPRPQDALANPLSNLRADDAAAIPDIMEQGRAQYREWLTWGGAKAFAIAPNGNWGRAGGIAPTEAGASLDPVMRALYNCKRAAKQACQLYAVNGRVVLDSEFATRAEAALAQERTAAAAPQPAMAQPLAPSGFARLEEVDLVPYLPDRGRAEYKQWLAGVGPRAFALSASGYWGHAVGTVPKDPAMPVDPVARALAYCGRSSPAQPCKLYAVDGAVVYVRD